MQSSRGSLNFCYLCEQIYLAPTCKSKYPFRKAFKTTKNKDNKHKKKDKTNQSHFLKKAVSFFTLKHLQK